MNNFTKEELIELKRGVDALFEQRDFNDKPETLLLGWKVQSLIDNYCGHKCSVCKTVHYGGHDCGIGRIKSE